MLKSAALALIACFVVSLTPGDQPAPRPDQPNSASDKSSAPKSKAAGPASKKSEPGSDTVLSPTEAAKREGQKVTVEFAVGSTGSNSAGYLELYSGRSWQEEGSFFIRFSEESQKKFKKLNILDVRSHFKGTTVRVSGEVKLIPLPVGPRAVIYVEDVGQIEVVDTPVVAAKPGIKDDGALFNPPALARATKEIEAIGRRYKRPLVIETFKEVPAEFAEKFKALDLKDSKATGEFFSAWAAARWKTAEPNSTYILLFNNPSYVFMHLGAEKDRVLFTPIDRRDLINGLAKGLREANKAREEAEKRWIRGEVLLDALAMIRDRSEAGLNPPRLVQNSKYHSSYTGGLVFSRDDSELITVAFDNTIRLWDVKTREPLGVVRPPRHGGLYRSVISPDGRQLAISSGDQIYLIERSGWKIEHILMGHRSSVTKLAFSADGKRLASSSDEKTVRIWSTRDGKSERTLEDPTAVVVDVAFSPDGGRLLTCSSAGTARIWSLNSGETEAVLPGHPKGTNHQVAWSPDGKTLATGGTGELRFWDPDGTPRTTVGGVGDLFYDLAFTPDSRRIVFTQKDKPTTKRETKLNLCSVVDVASGRVAAGLAVQTNSAEPHTALSHDGRFAMTLGVANMGMVLWRVEDGQIVRKPVEGTASAGTAHPGTSAARKEDIASVGWSPEEKSVIAFGQSRAFVGPNNLGPLERSFDLASLDWATSPTPAFLRAQEVQDTRSLIWKDSQTVVVKEGDKPDVELTFKNEDQTVFCYTFLPGNRAAIGTRRYAVYVMDTVTGKKISNHFGHDQTVIALAPSPDGRFFLSSDGVTIRLWSQTPTRLLLSFKADGDDWIAWTPEGYYAASPAGEELMGWEVSNGPDQMQSFYPASKFRKTYYRPDVIKRLLDAGSLAKALAMADAERGKESQQAEVAHVLPPRVAINSPAPKARINGRTIDVEAVAHGVGNNPVTSLKLLLDGRPVPNGLKSFTTPVKGETHARWTVELPPGVHQFTVRADSAASNAISDPVEVVSASADADAARSSRVLHILAIGVNKYDDRRIPGLDCAAPDARTLRDAFQAYSRKLFGRIEAKLLTDSQATRANVLEEFRRLASVVKPDDVAVVFFAGHGIKIADELYLVPHDADKGNLKSTGLSGAWLKESMGEWPCTAMLVLDACYTGSIDARPGKNRAIRQQGDALLRDLMYDYGVVVMCGASKEQEAGEGERNGFFTQAIVEGLSGKADYNKDGLVKFTEMETWVTDRVLELSRRMGEEQEPTFSRTSLVRSFVLSKP